MTRADTQSPQTIAIKQNPKRSNLCRFLSLLLLVLIVAAIYFIHRPGDSLGDPSDQYVVKTIPNIYTRLEAIDPDEREIFEGFRTSFLPSEEVVLARANSSKEVNEDNVNNDILIWGSTDMEQSTPTRVKRMSHFTFTYEDYDLTPHHRHKDEGNEDISSDDSENESGIDETYESVDTSDQYQEEENLESIVPQTHVDRGPIDDVVEQIRGQPELEEGELGSSANVYKPTRPQTGIHAFWKGQGDRDTIRTTQVNIMKQYMDPEADPCHDFYQYACGNWAALKPIPADKAGYDTFEMLRENLDTVLRDLLEFKPNEQVSSSYPGPHLDTKDNFLKKFKTLKCKETVHDKLFPKTIETQSKEINGTEAEEYQYEVNLRGNKEGLLNRIRRYLGRNTKDYVKSGSKVNDDLSKNNERKYKTIKKAANFKNTAKMTQHKKLVGIRSKHARYGRKLQIYKPPKKRHVRDLYEIQTELTKLLKNSNDDPAHGDAALKARYLFKSCMNYEILQKRGHQPLLDLLNLLGGWPILSQIWNEDDFDWLELMAKLRLYNNDILITEWVGPDIKNSDEYVIQFDQTSLGLPTRDYFLHDSNREYLDAYKHYLIKIALLLGGDHVHVRTSAEQLINFEIKLARITSAPEDRRNVSELYRRMPLKKLETLVPQVKWRKYLCIVMNRTVHSDETVVLFALNYVRHLVQLIEETDPATLSNYLLWRFVRHRVNNLDDRFQSAKQQFYFKLFGREQSPPRWKNCVSQVNSNMGMALGSMFVRKYFDEMSKNDTLTMTREIQKSFKELLHLTDWIDDKTKKLAAHKVDAMMLRIGYPDFILNKNELDERYKEVMIHPDKYFENILNILQHLTKMEQSRIGQPVNKTLWNTAPAVVNAYYSRNKNQIMFPAGILQPPFYHRHFPRSLNYGGIGVVIGHEITHGFDDKGRLFDCDGNLHRWWSDSAIEAFHRRAQCLIDQYGQYVVPEVNMKLDGVNTQGENIADNGGVKQAFRAYLQWVKRNGVDGETLPGLNHTHTQLFFLNFAQVWCGAMRPEAMRNKLKTAVHSPGRFRVIGTLSNSHDFAREFRCAPGSPMNPTHKCTVW